MTGSETSHGDVISEVRSMLLREMARVDDPVSGVSGGDPSDIYGWKSYNADDESPSSAPGRPYYEAESWRWFRLIDLTMLDGDVLVKFGWDEPGTPPLAYLVIVNVARYANNARAAALTVRAHLRVLLAPLAALPSAPSNENPGWRNRVSRIWLKSDVVVVSQPWSYRSQSEFDQWWHLVTDIDDAPPTDMTHG